jgi:arylsulfatase A-like enzyme
MNFVFICIDTLRYDHLGCNGNDWIVTPNLDAFAREAIVFDNAYLGSFPTIPHRTDVFTGRFGEPFHPWLPLRYDALTMPALLGKAGWATYLVFDTPHLINGGHGFDYPFYGWHFERGNEVDQHVIDDLDPGLPAKYAPQYHERMRRFSASQYFRNNRYRHLEEQWPAPRTFKAAGDFLERNRRREKYFLWVDSFDPHEPWDPPDHYVALYDDPDFDRDSPMTGWEAPDKLSPEELRHVQAHYAGEVTMVDRHLGMFLDRLAATGRDKDTAVIVTCDHGTNAGDHGLLSKGGPIYEQVGHVVLMARLPGVQPGRRSGIVQPADLMPTLLELAELPVPEVCQGRSFVEMIAGHRDVGREVAISGVGVDLTWGQRMGMGNVTITAQDERWCLIDSPDASKRELYDKEVDRAEKRNVIADHAQEAEGLHRAVLDFLSNHDAHPAWVRWFETGDKGDLTDYQHRSAYLAKFMPYFMFTLDMELHG